ncbi:hypothetical protein KAFR_0B05150 [Kazachstania africana CBS 2517]|uniref:Uncharacterized protein n=1 Tax=Kazachstania africana (strain ATCC 22294 / BCRC 22015 / CBS 2517 / CECT 1963 / NBRC 1671 / NRRL Y-8276) TaxID=1071382 RepID=H2AR11_KAZAF|nr:hypothetical protein KAFR_0B05150 [Kazachstania africana CBS 2517]CCF56811.1 hypothetical protein KAFR_0B05150 [Kazachstania africana CBS 2517]
MVFNKSILYKNYYGIETKILEKLKTTPYVHQFIHDRISGRITLFLIIMGSLALVQEMWVSIEMTLLQKEAYDELNIGRIDEGLRLHKVLVNDEYHSREFLDEKSGIVIEEFEDRDKFFSKPVHVSNLYVDCNISVSNEYVLEKPLKYHIEFLPEDFENEKRPEFGCSLGVLRLKLYHLFKDSELYDEFIKTSGKKFTISNNVVIYNRFKEELPAKLDDIQLCFLKIETKDRIKCDFII